MAGLGGSYSQTRFSCAASLLAAECVVGVDVDVGVGMGVCVDVRGPTCVFMCVSECGTKSAVYLHSRLLCGYLYSTLRRQ